MGADAAHSPAKRPKRFDKLPASWNRYYREDNAGVPRWLLAIMNRLFGEAPSYLPIRNRDYITPDINAHLLQLYKKMRLGELFRQTPTPSLIELGCGQAKFALKIAQLHPNLFCQMVDFSEALREELERTIAQDNLNAEFILSDVLALPVERQFDLVYGGALLCHLEESECAAAMETFVRLCRQGGLIINAEPAPSLELEILHGCSGIPESAIKGRPLPSQELAALHQSHGLEILYTGKACIFQRFHTVRKLPLAFLIRTLPHLALSLPAKLLELPCSFFMKRREHFAANLAFLLLRPLYQVTAGLCLAFAGRFGSHNIIISRKQCAPANKERS